MNISFSFMKFMGMSAMRPGITDYIFGLTFMKPVYTRSCACDCDIYLGNIQKIRMKQQREDGGGEGGVNGPCRGLHFLSDFLD